MNKFIIASLLFLLIAITITILHNKTSGGLARLNKDINKDIKDMNEIPLLNTIEEIKEFIPVATIQYQNPIGPVKEIS